MRRSRYSGILPAIVAVLMLVASMAPGQQPNSTQASMTVNGYDPGSYPIMLGLPLGSYAILEMVGQPSTPFIIAGGRLGLWGADLGPAGLFDLDVMENPVILFNGFDLNNPWHGASSFPPFNNHHSLGPFYLQVEGDLGIQAIVADPMSTSGYTLTAATRVLMAPGTVTEIQFASEDSSVFHPFSTGTFNFLGVSYTGMYVNSNGSVTFGAPDTSDQPDALAMSTGPPRIALCWRDLDPTDPGSVWITEDAGHLTLDWFDIEVLHPGGIMGFPFEGTMELDLSTGDVEISVRTSPGGTQVMGFSAGGLPAASPSTNISRDAPFLVSNVKPLFEEFSADSGFDLFDARMSMSGPDANGLYDVTVSELPVSVTQVLPPIGPATGLATVVIKGAGFVSGTQVTVDGVTPVLVDRMHNEELMIITPPGTEGFADIQLDIPGYGPFILEDVYEYQTLSSLGAAIPFSAGTSVEVPFMLGFIYPFFGNWYESLWLNSNGTITFGGSDPDPVPSPAVMENGLPRIALLWNDWQPTPTSTFAVHFTPYFLTMGLTDVVSPNGGSPVTLAVMLSHHGEVFFQYGLGGTPPVSDDLLAGVSPGGAVATASGFVDASSFLGPSTPYTGVYEVFGASNPFDLTGLDWDLVPWVNVAPYFGSSTHQ